MIMQGLGLFQLQEPAGHSKNATLSKANQGGLKGTFEDVLAGFLGSQTIKENLENANNPENAKNPENSLIGLLGNPEDKLMASLVLLDNMQSELPAMTDEESDFLVQKLMSDKSPEFIQSFLKQEEMPEEMLKVLSKNFAQLLEKIKFSNSQGLNGLTNKPESQNGLKEMIMSGELTGKNIAEFIAMQEALKKDGKGHKASNLGRELMNILIEGNDGKIKDVAAAVAALRSEVTTKQEVSKQEATITNQQVVPTEEEETAKNFGSVIKAEVNQEKGSSSELVRPSIMAGGTMANENLQVKEEMGFQRIIDSNIKFQDEVLPEKVETKHLPKFIENQIKNSLKNGQAGSREITVKIHPEHLGKLTLKIVSDENKDMSVRIMAENRNVKEFLDTNLGNLRMTLENSGIKASSFSLEIDFEKNFSQFSESNQSNQKHSGKNSKQQTNENEELFEQQMDSIFNQSGGIEVLA